METVAKGANVDAVITNWGVRRRDGRVSTPTPDVIDRAFTELASDGTEGVTLATQPMMTRQSARIAAGALAHKLSNLLRCMSLLLCWFLDAGNKEALHSQLTGPLGSCSRAAGWSAATLCVGTKRTCRPFRLVSASGGRPDMAK